MNLPVWTILPTIIGFFLMFLTNETFSSYILGIEGKEAIDVTRLILNSFLIGIIPTISCLGFYSAFIEANKIRFWLIGKSESFKQICFIVFTVAYTTSMYTIFKYAGAEEIVKKVAIGIINTNKDTSIMTTQFAKLESDYMKKANDYLDLGLAIPSKKSTTDKLVRTSIEMSVLARDAKLMLQSKDANKIKQTNHILDKLVSKQLDFATTMEGLEIDVIKMKLELEKRKNKKKKN